MGMLALVLWLSLGSGQEDPRILVEQLRRDRPEEREEARRKLKKLGTGGLTELKKAARDPDVEVSTRARELIRVIELRSTLTPNLLKAFPDADEKLGIGDDRAWTELVLKMADSETPPKRRFVRADVAPLIDRAARGARTVEEKLAICHVAIRWDFRSAAASIREYLNDPSLQLACKAATTLGVLGDRGAVPGLLALIKRVPDERVFAALQELGAKSELVNLLQHPESAVRGEAVLKLQREEWSDTAPEVTKLLKDPEASVRGKAASTLGFFGRKEALPAITELLKDESFDCVYYALEALVKLQAKESIPEIIKVLDRPGQIRGEAAKALAYLNAKEAIPKILPHLRDPDGNARMRIAGALAMLGARDAIPGLIAMLHDDDFVLRQIGVESLSRLAGKEALPHLRPLLRDHNERVVANVITELVRLEDRDAVPDLWVLAADEKSGFRPEAIEGIAKLGDSGQVPDLLKYLDDQDEAVRAAAVRAVTQLDGARQRATVAKRLSDSGALVRGAAVEAIGRLRDRSMTAQVEALLEDPDAEVAFAAAKAGCVLGSRKAAAALLAGEKDVVWINSLRAPEDWVRLEAIARTGYRSGTKKELAEDLAKQAGLEIVWSEKLSEPARHELSTVLAPDGWSWDVPITRRELLEFLLPQQFDFVLESGRLVPMSCDDAVAYWRDWLDRESRKPR